jgi:hypothetical protein
VSSRVQSRGSTGGASVGVAPGTAGWAEPASTVASSLSSRKTAASASRLALVRPRGSRRVLLARVRLMLAGRLHVVLVGPAPLCTVAATLLRRAHPGVNTLRITARPNDRPLRTGTYQLRVISTAGGPTLRSALSVGRDGEIQPRPLAEARFRACDATPTIASVDYAGTPTTPPSAGGHPVAAPPASAQSIGPNRHTSPSVPNPVNMLRGHDTGSIIGWLLLALIATGIIVPSAALARRLLRRA